MDQAQVLYRSTTPSWNTSVPLSVLGPAAGFALGFLSEYVAFALNLAGVLYALLCYPKYFEGDGFTGGNPRLVSFLNTLLGGFFGLLWNHNLTNGKKGVSHIVYAVLLIAFYALAVASGVFTLTP